MEEEHVDAPFDQYEARTGADRLKNNIGDNEADVMSQTFHKPFPMCMLFRLKTMTPAIFVVSSFKTSSRSFLALGRKF